MNNDIMKFLNIEDKDIIISKILIDGNTKIIYLEKTLKVEYCPACSSRMHSKGKYIRKINHPILQDGYQLKLIVTQRKWRCTNPQCNLYFNDQFNFISKYKQSSNITPYMILNEMKNIHITTADVARKYNISDTSVILTISIVMHWLSWILIPQKLSIFFPTDGKKRPMPTFYLFHWKNEKTLNTLSVTCTIPISTIRSVTFLTVLPSLIVFTLFLGS
ncbi:Transposase and inactivated derivatives [uncultured Clostridium sp.]|nr:Transposase and inactivated derivatives [uncultured Clostridium sp.]